MREIRIIGAGLAGCEAALYIANSGFKVKLFEQKPNNMSPAHKKTDFAELVCSNSFKSERFDSAAGLLKAEMELLGSSLLPIAKQNRVAAGGALAVDRDKFALAVTNAVNAHQNITVYHQEVCKIDEDDAITIVASGPLTSGKLAEEIHRLTGENRLAFYDAAAPIITADSLDMDEVFAASRYGKGDADYINCPFDKAGYEDFCAELSAAQQADLHEFDKAKDGEKSGFTVYEGCMPIEVMAKRGADTMRFGPLRPVGLTNPKTGHRPWANVQLRIENEARTLYNIVGFQTNLKFAEQKRVFSMIPGLKNAEFVRYGVMHRNTFLNSPVLLNKSLCLKQHSSVYFAGQITGFEGYMESAASGLIAAINVVALLKQEPLPEFPQTTMCGALLSHVTSSNKDFQPMGANMGILPPLEEHVRDKRLRYEQIATRSIEDLKASLDI